MSIRLRKTIFYACLAYEKPSFTGLHAYEKPSFSLRKTIFYAYKRLKVNTLQAP